MREGRETPRVGKRKMSDQLCVLEVKDKAGANTLTAEFVAS